MECVVRFLLITEHVGCKFEPAEGHFLLSLCYRMNSVATACSCVESFHFQASSRA